MWNGSRRTKLQKRRNSWPRAKHVWPHSGLLQALKWERLVSQQRGPSFLPLGWGCGLGGGGGEATELRRLQVSPSEGARWHEQVENLQTFPFTGFVWLFHEHLSNRFFVCLLLLLLFCFLFFASNLNPGWTRSLFINGKKGELVSDVMYATATHARRVYDIREQVKMPESERFQTSMLNKLDHKATEKQLFLFFVCLFDFHSVYRT